jgi:uncharacterized membrane protein
MISNLYSGPAWSFPIAIVIIVVFVLQKYNKSQKHQIILNL